MLEKIGLFTVCVGGGALITFLSWAFSSDFAIAYVGDSVSILSGLLGLALAAIIFLLGILLDMENTAKKEVFSEVRKEIGGSIYVMLISLVIDIIAASANSGNVEDFKNSNNWLDFVTCVVSISILFLHIYLIYDIVRLITMIRPILPTKK